MSGISSDGTMLADLAARVEQAAGPDRDLDAEIAERLYGWRPHRIPPDYDGDNACDVLTPNGGPFTADGKAWVYPPTGTVHRAYHCPAWTRDCLDPAFPRSAVRQQTAALIRARLVRAVGDAPSDRSYLDGLRAASEIARKWKSPLRPGTDARLLGHQEAARAIADELLDAARAAS